MVLKRPVGGSLSLPRLLRADLAHCLGTLDKEQRRGEKKLGSKRLSKRRGSSSVVQEAEEDVWYLRNKFLLLCEVLRAHFQVIQQFPIKNKN